MRGAARASGCALPLGRGRWCWHRPYARHTALGPILTVGALALRAADDASLEALAVFFETAGLFAVASLVMAGGVSAGTDLGPKRLRIPVSTQHRREVSVVAAWAWAQPWRQRGAPLKGRFDGTLALIIILGVIVAALTVAREAVLPRRKALAVELQAARVTAVAALALLSTLVARATAAARGLLGRREGRR